MVIEYGESKWEEVIRAVYRGKGKSRPPLTLDKIQNSCFGLEVKVRWSLGITELALNFHKGHNIKRMNTYSKRYN